MDPEDPDASEGPVIPLARAVIGDQLRMPVMWCEMGSCISWHADPAALGEADTRARAIRAGWRIDALGRLACPQCQQADPGFRATQPVVLWDRYTAMARAARVAAVRFYPAASLRRPSVVAGKQASPDERLAVTGEVGRTVRAAHPSHLPGSTGRRWLLLAAEMVGLANASRRASPDPAVAGPARIAMRTLSGDAGSVRAARRFTVATLRRWGTAQRSQDIAVVVSELLANALRHALPGSGDTRIQLGLLQQRPWLLCAVADPSPAAPVPRVPESLAEGGRGLQMVCALSDRWGYAPVADAGKVVWAVFYSRPALSA